MSFHLIGTGIPVEISERSGRARFSGQRDQSRSFHGQRGLTEEGLDEQGPRRSVASVPTTGMRAWARSMSSNATKTD